MRENDVFAVMAEMAAKCEPGAVATVIRADRSAPRHPGSKMVLRADGSTVGSVGGGVVEARAVKAAAMTARDGECRTLDFDLDGKDGVCGGGVSIFIEPISVGTPLLIIGGGHVGRAMVELGRDLPFRFTVVDDREELSPPAGVDFIPAAARQWPEVLQPTARTAVLLANRSHALDGEALRALFAAEDRVAERCAWIGIIGSSGKARHLRELFAADPDLLERFDRVAVPAGLAIAAETPHEIALSVLAEVLAVCRGADFVPGAAGESAGLWLQRQRKSGGGKEVS